MVTLEARAHGSVHLRPGDRVFFWWSETQAGAGLAGHGVCVEASESAGRWRAAVEIVTDSVTGFGKAALAPFRDAADGGPHATLAAKLYRHAHNKVLAVTPAEEAFLDRLIEGVTPPSA